jgi:hypothetical protein
MMKFIIKKSKFKKVLAILGIFSIFCLTQEAKAGGINAVSIKDAVSSLDSYIHGKNIDQIIFNISEYIQGEDDMEVILSFILLVQETDLKIPLEKTTLLTLDSTENLILDILKAGFNEVKKINQFQLKENC